MYSPTHTNFSCHAQSKEIAAAKVWAACKEGITKDEMISAYAQWAKTFDQDMTKMVYEAPRQSAEALADVLQNNKNARILDCACGTGGVGKKLNDLGFSNVDGLDICPEMLNVAKEKGVYNNLICEGVGPQMKIEDERYDAVIAVGVFLEGHVKCDCFAELIRITKPGGYIVFSVSAKGKGTNRDLAENLDRTLEDLEAKGLWSSAGTISVDLMTEDSPGWIYRYKVKVTPD